MFFLSPNQHHQSTEGKLFIANGKDTRLVTVHNGILWQGGHKPGKSGILRDFSEHEKLREFSENSVQPLRKTVTNKVFLVRHSNICVRFFDWVSRIIRNRDEVRVWWWPVILLELVWNDPWWRSLLHLLFCENLWKSKFMALEKPGKIREFFLLLCGHLVKWSNSRKLVA